MITDLIKPVLVSACLLVPFGLTTLHLSEPYPAVIMPAGAGKVRFEGGSVLFERWLIDAVLGDGSRVGLDPQSFFDPIPVQYWTRLASREFGFTPPSDKELRLGVWRLSVNTNRANSDSDRAEVRAWFKQRLVREGLADAVSLDVRFVRQAINVLEQTHEMAEVLREFSIAVD